MTWKGSYVLLKNLIQKVLVQMVIELQRSCVRMAWFYIVCPCNHWHSTCKEATSASLQIPTLSSGMIIFHTLWYHITYTVNTTAYDTKINPSVLTHYPVMINTLQIEYTWFHNIYGNKSLHQLGSNTSHIKVPPVDSFISFLDHTICNSIACLKKWNLSMQAWMKK